MHIISLVTIVKWYIRAQCCCKALILITSLWWGPESQAHWSDRATVEGHEDPRRASLDIHGHTLQITESPQSTFGSVFSHQMCWGSPGSCHTDDHLGCKDSVSYCKICLDSVKKRLPRTKQNYMIALASQSDICNHCTSLVHQEMEP